MCKADEQRSGTSNPTQAPHEFPREVLDQFVRAVNLIARRGPIHNGHILVKLNHGTHRRRRTFPLELPCDQS